MPLVKCLHYSVTYPTGMQNIGDIFNLPKNQADYFSKLGWVEVLLEESQPIPKKGRKRLDSNIETNYAIDLSKSEVAVGSRLIEHRFVNKGGRK